MTKLQFAIKHLKKDPILKPLTQKYELKEYWGGQSNHFLDLVEIVTGQQLSLKAATTIYDRFLNLFENKTPLPKQVIDISIETLRSVGFSNSKAQYVKNIATAV